MNIQTVLKIPPLFRAVLRGPTYQEIFELFSILFEAKEEEKLSSSIPLMSQRKYLFTVTCQEKSKREARRKSCLQQ